MPAAQSTTPLIAIDIGNSRVKLGLFDKAPEAGRLPLPTRVLDLPTIGLGRHSIGRLVARRADLAGVASSECESSGCRAVDRMA